ncbi:MAG: type II toxin-antitoxin system VapC family toxin [Candidatus Bathyarchaeota archaeon]|nr:type II toxin-antitoxin system VapC family toxin [Candidatus Bathyarchaeota archaeon]
MKSEDTVFIDSNIWCYYFDSRLQEHSQIAGVLRDALTSMNVIVNTVIVMEVAHYLSRNLEPSQAQRVSELFINLENLTILDFDQPMMRSSISYLNRFSKTHGLGGRDSTIITSIMEHKVASVMSHDRSLLRLMDELGIKTIDPMSK